MAAVLPSEPTPIEPPPFRIARFTVEKYHQMIDSGLFTEDDRYELLDGWLVEKMTKRPPHELVIALLSKELTKLVPDGWHVRNQAPITLENSVPEPDLTVVRGVERDYTDRHPSGDDIVLAVEVVDTTLRTDRLKARIYAEAGIPDYWIVNLSERRIEVQRDPDATGRNYGSITVSPEEETVEVAVGGATWGTIQAADCLP